MHALPCSRRSGPVPSVHSEPLQTQQEIPEVVAAARSRGRKRLITGNKNSRRSGQGEPYRMLSMFYSLQLSTQCDIKRSECSKQVQ